MNTTDNLFLSIRNLKKTMLFLFVGINIISCEKKAEIIPIAILETPKAPIISSVSPTSGDIGTKVVIVGSNFSATISENIVKFGSVIAVVDSATTTRLVTKVPKEAVAGKISVEVAGKTVATTANFGVSATLIINPFIDVLNAADYVTEKSITVTSTIKEAGSNKILKYGHVWSKTNIPLSIADSKTENGATEGPFPLKVVSELKNLEANTTYYVSTYATTSNGTFYGLAFEVKTKTAITMSIEIPDFNFEKALIDLKIDKDGIVNGKVSSHDVASVKMLLVGNKKIKNLKGIEAFTNLEYLDCSGNQISGVDLDVSQNKKLTYLNCSSNQLFGAYFFPENLESIECDKNKITVLIFNGDSQLKSLTCYKNELVVLNVNACTKLEYINCANNKLENIQMGNHLSLKEFDCSNNLLKNLNISAMGKLESLTCGVNKITNLDVSKNSKLVSFYCNGNLLTSLDVSMNNSMMSLNCSSNQLSSLDLSKSNMLRTLGCAGNQLATLDVSKNSELQTLSVGSNKLLSALNVSNNLKLTNIEFTKSQLNSIDVSKNTELKDLRVSDNQLSSIDLSKNIKLTGLDLYNNKLTSLDISKNGALVSFNCRLNATLQTICVAEVDKAKVNTSWQKDANAQYKKCD